MSRQPFARLRKYETGLQHHRSRQGLEEMVDHPGGCKKNGRKQLRNDTRNVQGAK